MHGSKNLGWVSTGEPIFDRKLSLKWAKNYAKICIKMGKLYMKIPIWLPPGSSLNTHTIQDCV